MSFLQGLGHQAGTSRSRCAIPSRGWRDCFLTDLAESVQEVRSNPGVSTGMAPVYGMASTLPAEVVRQVLTGYLDMLVEV